MDVNELRQMVEDVNDKEVAVDEVLSGEVYYFKREGCIVGIAS